MQAISLSSQIRGTSVEEVRPEPVKLTVIATPTTAAPTRGPVLPGGLPGIVATAFVKGS
jgi:hypothetical protein